MPQGTVAETLPTDLLRLMGYDRGAYALGYIDDLRESRSRRRCRPGTGSSGFGANSEGAQGPAAGCTCTRARCIGVRGRSTTTVGAVPVEIRQAAAYDHDELYAAFSRIVNAGEGFHFPDALR